MREDMDEVIIERPRRPKHKGVKEKFGRRNNKNIPLDELPSKESHKRTHISRSYPNENLQPLRRYLESNVGRPWNKVYSDICSNLNTNSAVQLHILQHIYDYVQDRCFIGPDGRVWVGTNSHNRFLHRGEVPLEDLHQRDVLYVHPVDGLLKKLKRPKGWKTYWKRDKPVEPQSYNGPKGFQYHKIDGIWYLITLKPMPPAASLQSKAMIKNKDGKEEQWIVPNNVGAQVDVLLKHTLFYLSKYTAEYAKFYGSPLREKYGHLDMYGAAIKQMNRRELKVAGLKNDKEDA